MNTLGIVIGHYLVGELLLLSSELLRGDTAFLVGLRVHFRRMRRQRHHLSQARLAPKGSTPGRQICRRNVCDTRRLVDRKRLPVVGANDHSRGLPYPRTVVLRYLGSFSQTHPLAPLLGSTPVCHSCPHTITSARIGVKDSRRRQVCYRPDPTPATSATRAATPPSCDIHPSAA